MDDTFGLRDYHTAKPKPWFAWRQGLSTLA